MYIAPSTPSSRPRLANAVTTQPPHSPLTNRYSLYVLLLNENLIFFLNLQTAQSFIAFQVLFSLLPILLFILFALSTFFLTLCAAVIFTLFWIGVASLFLIPTLFITSSLAVLCWGSSVGSFVVARWLYHHAPAGVFPDSSGTSSPGTDVTSDGAWKDVQVKQFDNVKSLE